MITRAQKAEEISQISDRFAKAKATFIVDFKGMNVEQTTSLRKQLYPLQSEMRVVRNTLAKNALKSHPDAEKALKDDLKGTNALVFAYNDVGASAKALSDFAKDVETFVVKSGVMEGQKLDEGMIKYLATLPPKDVLRAQLLGVFAAPASQFVRVLNEVPSSFVRVLNTYNTSKGA